MSISKTVSDANASKTVSVYFHSLPWYEDPVPCPSCGYWDATAEASARGRESRHPSKCRIWVWVYKLDCCGALFEGPEPDPYDWDVPCPLAPGALFEDLDPVPAWTVGVNASGA